MGLQTGGKGKEGMNEVMEFTVPVGLLMLQSCGRNVFYCELLGTCNLLNSYSLCKAHSFLK